MTSQPSDRTWSRLTTLIVFWVLAILPFHLVSLGWRPPDDAMRHVGKVLSGKSWSEILVLRPEATVDPAAGWHAWLDFAHRAGVRSGTALLVFSVVFGATLYLLTPLAFCRRPEAWGLALAIVALGEPVFWKRVMLGRPFLVSMTVLSILAWSWRSFRADRWPWRSSVGLAFLMALATWMHGSWYLFALPLAGLALSREVRAAGRVALAMAAGVLLGALLTGAPLAFLHQTALHPVWALATKFPQTVLVSEFQPSGGALAMVAVVLATIAWRRLKGQSFETPLAGDPIFCLAVLGWALGLHTMRFWLDWGLPAALVWLTQNFEAQWPEWREEGAVPRQRLLSTLAIVALLFLAVGADVGGRWSSYRNRPFLHADNPQQAPWLPEPGGILYSNSMRVFYDQFFENPRAPWRYMVGFEPALMPPRDVRIFRTIQLEGAGDASFLPWIERMRPEDRLVIVRSGSSRPKLPQLEWFSPYRGMWIGRLPSAPTPGSPPTPPA